MKLRPTGHRVLVRLLMAEEKSSGGIIVMRESDRDRHTKGMQEATVMELGSNAYKAFDDGHPWCAVGEKVMIAKYSGEDRKDPATGEIYRIINDEDVFAIIEEA